MREKPEPLTTRGHLLVTVCVVADFDSSSWDSHRRTYYTEQWFFMLN